MCTDDATDSRARWLTSPVPASTLLYIDLRSDWVNSSVIIQSLSKPTDIPDLVEAGLWYHQASNTIYGGFAGRRSVISDPSPDQYPLGIFSFKPDSNGLGTFDTALDDSAWGSNTRPMQGAIAFSNDTGYVLGGCASSDTSPDTADYDSPVALDGLLTFDMDSQKLSNISATDYNGNGTVEFARMEFVATYGPKGIFVVLGGDQPFNVDGSAGEDNLIPFTSVSVYDPYSNKWYQQTTSGNIPEPRKEFCTAGVASANETYEIFLYAGWGGNLGSRAIVYDEIFILTLPAFTWVKVNYPPKAPRHALSCNAVGGSQIVTIGGLDTASADAFSANVYIDVFNKSDPFANGLNIFDMTTLSFADKYTANPPPYTQSNLIASVYNPNPNTQYDDPGLATLMQEKIYNPITIGISGGSSSNSTNPNPEPSVTPTSSNNGGSGHSHTGAIVGGVVGGIVGLALLSAAAFYFLRRHRQQRQGGAYTPANQTPAPMMQQQQQERDAGPLAGTTAIVGGGAAGYYAPHDRKDHGAFPSAPAAPQELSGPELQEMEGDATAQEVHGDAHSYELSAVSPTAASRSGGGSSSSYGDGGAAYVPAGRKRDVRGLQELHPVARSQGGRGATEQQQQQQQQPISDSEELYGATPTNTDGSPSARGSEFGSRSEGTGTGTGAVSLADTLRMPDTLRPGTGSGGGR